MVIDTVLQVLHETWLPDRFLAAVAMNNVRTGKFNSAVFRLIFRFCDEPRIPRPIRQIDHAFIPLFFHWRDAI